MAQMTTKYLGELRTEGTHIKSGNKLLTDAPTDNNGKGEAYSPTDLVCSALSSCMMTIMGIIAMREAIDLIGLQAEVTKVMSADPRKISEIHVKFLLDDTKLSKLSEKERTVLKRAAHTCPVALSLHPDIKQVIEFNF